MNTDTVARGVGVGQLARTASSNHRNVDRRLSRPFRPATRQPQRARQRGIYRVLQDETVRPRCPAPTPHSFVRRIAVYPCSFVKSQQEDTRVARNWAQDGKKASLREYDLAGANLSGKDLAGADLEDCNLTGAQLWETNFSGANLIRANFRNAQLREIKLNGARLHLASFDGATLRGVDFTGAKLRRTKLGSVKRIEGCIWSGAKIDETTELIPGLRKAIQEQLSQTAVPSESVQDSISSANPQSPI